ncbi:MAG: aspartyl/glutamyl-tRNA(Asn/Gln) amidotransferase subunit C [Deltaproteobacteria bacterium]|jgi:aspartyl-tRNA(Asn)/glutamyl-tRNA(Gln) amidotransferase subunit C|nr:MAG: aspartyl/glutamyl-tRNA(Asn/Gln) amidotransferase subunit C [Deltaproteobacteria bacterium]
MKITKETVLHVAELSRLEFNQEELEKFTEQLGRILQYVEKLNELDTSDIEPTFHVLDLSTPLREDVVESWLTQDEALENAPYSEEGFFAVPKFIED